MTGSRVRTCVPILDTLRLQVTHPHGVSPHGLPASREIPINDLGAAARRHAAAGSRSSARFAVHSPAHRLAVWPAGRPLTGRPQPGKAPCSTANWAAGLDLGAGRQARAPVPPARPWLALPG